jgi:hypothetical protein
MSTPTTVSEMESTARNFGARQVWFIRGFTIQAVPEYTGDHRAYRSHVSFMVNGWQSSPEAVGKILNGETPAAPVRETYAEMMDGRLK